MKHIFCPSGGCKHEVEDVSVPHPLAAPEGERQDSEEYETQSHCNADVSLRGYISEFKISAGL